MLALAPPVMLTLAPPEILILAPPEKLKPSFDISYEILPFHKFSPFDINGKGTPLGLKIYLLA